MSHSYLYGLDNANHKFDGSDKRAFGKNIFTNAFPVALARYMDDLGFGPIYISVVDDGGKFVPRRAETTLNALLGGKPSDVTWLFESSYSGYRAFSTNQPNRSDVVVANKAGEHLAALEIKLVTIPNSASARRKKEDQTCEIVVRPPSIEQLCFSIAQSFGASRRHDLTDIISRELVRPMDYEWSSERYMLGHLEQVIGAAYAVVREGMAEQAPFALNAVWRTQGQAPLLDYQCFDVFVWSNMAFCLMFITAAEATLNKQRKKKKIDRPTRSVIWLLKSLFDYSTQGIVTFEKTHSAITYGGQTDKAGAFTGARIAPFLFCDCFLRPRIASREYSKIIAPEGIALLKPERRLDAALVGASALGEYVSIPKEG